MAVAHSAASESHTGATGSASQAAFSWTHTQTGTPRGVVVFVSTYASVTSLVTSVTYGGVALTRLTGGLAQDAAGELGRLDTFFLGSGLGTGNQTITVNRTNNATVMYAAAATVTAGANTAVPEATIVLLQGDGTLAAQTVNDTSPGQNSVRYAGCYSGLNAPPTAGTGSTLLNSIDIGNYGSALVRETTAGQGARSIGFTGATDDRAAVHLAIRELVPRSLPQTVASFTLTGNGATFTKASPKAITAETGAFSLTGNPADLLHSPDLLAEAGAFALNGSPADTRHNVRIEGGTGAFTLAGQPATLAKAAVAKVLTAETGTFVFTGNPATTRVAVKLAGDLGKFFLPERNQRQWSEEFDNAYWTKTNSSVTANATTAPDGTLTADVLIENTTPSTGHQITRNVTYVTGKTYTHSCYFKLYPGPITRYARLQLGSATVFGGDTYININLATGTIFNTQGSPSATSITNEGNGWYRASITKQYTGAGATVGPAIQIIATGGSGLYTDADGLSGIYVWGAQWEESAAVTDYDPTGPASATDTALRQAYKLTAEVGTFTTAGQLATLARGRIFIAEAGAFTVAGQPATLRHNPRIEANTGSFALNGGAPALLRGRYLSGGAGTFTETGQPATFRRTWAIQGGTGSFTLSGNSAALTELGAYEIDPIAGSFTLSGQPANLAQSQTMPITVGTFTLTGQPATLRHSPALAADRGQFTFTGQPAALKQGYRLDGGTGSFALTGNPAILADTDRIEAATGVFALSGNPATLKRGLSLAGGTGAFAFTGNPATLTKPSNKQLAVNIAAFTFTGQPVGLKINTALIGGRGQFTLNGQSVQLIQNKKLYASAGAFSLLGNNATLQKVIPPKEIQAQSGSFALSGQTAVFAANLSVFASTGVIAFSGKPATFNYQQRRRVIIIF